MHRNDDSTLGGAWLRGLGWALVLGTGLLAATQALAGSDERRGTAGASELQIPVGARGTALGGAVVSDITGVEAMYWNPAGLAGIAETEALFTHTQYFADMRINYAGVATRAGSFGTVGIAAKILSVGDVIVTTEQAPDGTGEILHPRFSVLGLSWGRAFTDRVNFGATVNYVHEEVANNVANGVAFDFGVQYGTNWHGFRFGVAVKNIGTTMEFSGPGLDLAVHDPASDPNANPRVLDYSVARSEMPSFVVLSTSAVVARSPQYRLVALATFQNNNFSGDQVRGGVEWWYRDLVALRGSYFGTFNGTTDATGDETFKFKSGDDLYSGAALGAGISTRLGEVSKIGVDMSWRPVRSQFDDVVDIGVRLGF
ncbi:MAG: UPF0164 family protein [Candidatus Eisenbacteria bacterium]|uniref:UPF0164 family protein n=1 Tax=Eiseniibacteriota bacterium TaxID=2212470 RepID=A0A538U1A3_UNCEI|nr:MAG: UPF0164 family protein [Candidatus Eisenbacteria bacterium]